MKKLLFLILFCFFSLTAFAEEFSLFPWMCNQKDIYNYCTDKGWTYSADTSSKVPSFSFEPPESITYHGNSIYSIYFMFDKTGTVVCQAITFNDVLEANTTFPTILNLMIKDQTTLLDNSIKTEPYINITYKTKINDRVSADYVIYGQNNAFQLSVAYYTY